MALRLTDVTHRYGRTTALEGVSLHVREGECYGFLGHNGAGKTTAMRVALGLVRPRSGTVHVFGRSLSSAPRRARALSAGLIERPGFHDSLSAERNLRLLARLGGASRREAARDAGDALDAVGLTAAAGRAVGGFSQGMRQRLGIAQTLLGDARLLLLDEPTNGLDPEGIDEVRRLFRRLTEDEGRTLLVSSHRLAELTGVCNRVGILKSGRMLLEAETSALLVDDVVQVECAVPERAAGCIDDLGLAYTSQGTRFDVEASREESDALLPALVACGAQPRSVVRRPVTLESVYLRAAGGGLPVPESAGDSTPASAATDVRVDVPAAPAAIARVARYDLTRRGVLATAAALMLPCVAALVAVLRRAAAAKGLAEEVGGGTLASTTDVTAFEGFALALRAGVPLLAVVAAVIGSQQIAGELSRDTLRNVLTRPATRVDTVLGKALALVALCAAGSLLLVGTALAGVGLLFDFTDVSEMFNGERFPLVEAAELWPLVRPAALLWVPAVVACGALGLACGALVKRATAAMASVLGGLFVLEAGQNLLAGIVPAHVSPIHALPSWITQRSVVHHLLDRSQGVSNTTFEIEPSQWAVPLVWTAVSVALAAAFTWRRSVR